MSKRTLGTLLAVYVMAVIAISFHASMPTWCAHPEGDGNWIVIGFCPK